MGLLLLLCAVLFGAVAFVRFTVAKLLLLATGKGFRSLRRATGALPLDPATFEKVDETFFIFLDLHLKMRYNKSNCKFRYFSMIGALK